MAQGLAKTTFSPFGFTSLHVRLIFYAKIRSAATIFLEHRRVSLGLLFILSFHDTYLHVRRCWAAAKAAKRKLMEPGLRSRFYYIL